MHKPMTLDQIAALEAKGRAALHYVVRRIIAEYIVQRRAAGATDDEIAAEIEAQSSRLLDTVKVRAAEVRPTILEATFGFNPEGTTQ